MKRLSIFPICLVALIAPLLVFPSLVKSMPADSSDSLLEQPDGSEFNVQIKGDEWNNWIETTAGYTIEKSQDGFWRYVNGFENGTSLLSAVRADAPPPTGIEKHYHLSPPDLPLDPSNEFSGDDRSPLAPLAIPRGEFDGPILFILAEFTDRQGTYNEASWGNFIANNIADYFSQASYGKVNLTPANETSGVDNNGVVGWVNLGYNHPNTANNTGSNNQKITRDAIIAADAFIDYASYDTNSNGRLESDELAIVIVVAGFERSYSSNYTPSVWGHKWGIGSSVGAPTVDGVVVGGFSGGYAQFGEIHQRNSSDGHQATMGIMVHELGHLIFGLPDLYDTDGSSSGIGMWGLMSGGSWGRSNSDSWSGQTPVLPCAWTKLTLNWVNTVEGTGIRSITAAGSNNANGSNSVVKSSTSISTQYFLTENRQPQGYDRGLERYLGSNFGGLAVWHIDDTQSRNSNDSNRLVDLEEADGTQMGTSRGSRTDLWYAGNSVEFNELSNPNSNLYGGIPSAVSISEISASALVMNAEYGGGSGSGNDLFLVHDSGVIALGALENSILQSFDQIVQIDPAAGWSMNSIGDFNGDQRPDLLLYDSSGGGFRTVTLDGATILNDTVPFGLDPSTGLVPHGTGDFDGNGRDEIVVYDPDTGLVIFIFLDAAGAFSSFEFVTQVDTATNWTLHRMGDYNGDGKTDLLLYNTLNGTTQFLEMNGSTVNNTVGLLALDPAAGWALEETGDFDGNGSTDLLYLLNGSLLAVITLENSAVSGFFIPGSIPPDNQLVNAGKYNADNKDDFLFRNTITGEIFTAVQDGATITSITSVLTLAPATGWKVHSGKP